MILLSFDTEEFDVPREHGVDFTLEQGMAVSKVGTNRILDVPRCAEAEWGESHLLLHR